MLGRYVDISICSQSEPQSLSVIARLRHLESMQRLHFALTACSQGSTIVHRAQLGVGDVLQLAALPGRSNGCTSVKLSKNEQCSQDPRPDLATCTGRNAKAYVLSPLGSSAKSWALKRCFGA